MVIDRRKFKHSPHVNQVYLCPLCGYFALLTLGKISQQTGHKYHELHLLYLHMLFMPQILQFTPLTILEEEKLRRVGFFYI